MVNKALPLSLLDLTSLLARCVLALWRKSLISQSDSWGNPSRTQLAALYAFPLYQPYFVGTASPPEVV